MRTRPTSPATAAQFDEPPWRVRPRELAGAQHGVPGSLGSGVDDPARGVEDLSEVPGAGLEPQTPGLTQSGVCPRANQSDGRAGAGGQALIDRVVHLRGEARVGNHYGAGEHGSQDQGEREGDAQPDRQSAESACSDAPRGNSAQGKRHRPPTTRDPCTPRTVSMLVVRNGLSTFARRYRTYTSTTFERFSYS